MNRGVLVSFVAFVICFAAFSAQKIGTLKNCPGRIKNQAVEIDVSWSPQNITPNQWFTVVVHKLRVHKDLKRVKEEVTLWIPEQPKWPFYGPVVLDESDCSDSEIMQGLQLLNMTCPIRAGTKMDNKVFKTSSEKLELKFTGDIIAQGRLLDENNKELACVKTRIVLSEK